MSDWNIQTLRAQERKYILVVLRVEKVYKVLVSLLYGCGLRMSEVSCDP